MKHCLVYYLKENQSHSVWNVANQMIIYLRILKRFYVSLIGHVLIISVLKNHMKSFFDIIHEYTDIYAPLKTVHIPSKCIIREPCMTKGLLKSSITLSKMHKTNSGKSLNQQQLYKKYRNLCSKAKSVILWSFII